MAVSPTIEALLDGIGVSAVTPLNFEPFVSFRNHQEDRRFESPSLQQRGAANRWFVNTTRHGPAARGPR